MKTFAQRIRNRLSQTKTTTKFTVFYVCLVLLPVVVFISLYSRNLMLERQQEQKQEARMQTRQSAKAFGNILNQAASSKDMVQTNSAFIHLLDNDYHLVADELAAYNTALLPTINTIRATNPYVEDIRIYRYLSSAIDYEKMTSLFVDIQQFPYGELVLRQVKQQGAGYHILANPPEVSGVSTSQLLCFYPIYSGDYTKLTSILEVTMDLPTILRDINLHHHQEQVFLSLQGTIFSVFDDKLAPIATTDFTSIESSLPIQEPVDDTPLTFICHRQYPNIFAEVLKRTFTTTLFLLLPAVLFWLYVRHYTQRVHCFSQHIRQSQNQVLHPYKKDNSGDELGQLVGEYNRLVEKVHQLIESVKQSERLKNDANYYAMSSQVNPHFMFNTLENIRMRIEIEEYDSASDMLFVLSNFLRYNITMRRESTLYQELEHIERYLQIYHYRQSHQIQFTVNCEENVPDIACPFCILQPLVENCIKHGMTSLDSVLHIQVNVEVYQRHIIITISDNGKGISTSELAQLNTVLAVEPEAQNSIDGQVGVANVRSRLQYFYGEQGSLHFFPVVPHGLSCHISLPLDGGHPVV